MNMSSTSLCSLIPWTDQLLVSVNVLFIPAVQYLGELCSILCTAPGDYTSGRYSLSFSAGQTSDMLSVQTLDDTIAELEEFFKVMITGSDRPDKVVIGDPDTCFVTIQDNDGEFVLKYVWKILAHYIQTLHLKWYPLKSVFSQLLLVVKHQRMLQ